MKCSLCIDLLYLEIGPMGPVFSDTEKLLAGMELAKKTGYDTVEFWDWDTRDYERLIAKKQELGLAVSAICAKDRGTLTKPETFETAKTGLKETIEVAKRLECPNIIITADKNPELSREQCHKNIVEALRRLAPLAEAGSVTLVLEPISGGSYFEDSKEAFQVLKEVGSSHVKLLYDIFHYQLMEGNIVNTLKENLDLIGHLHSASVPGRNEITDGELNYAYIVKAIQEMGYQGYFGIEYLPAMEKEDSVIRCREFIEHACK
ncbi:MAG: TIM barrel protein [Lachnospiraceae bacterium]|nr:TIM barrel protein [Lachnospiraceae bacterium]